MRGTRVALLLLLVSAAAGCATVGGDPRDPLETVNRTVYGFNEKVDDAVLKPVATKYRQSVPSIVQTGTRNFFSNLGDLSISVNDLLQGKVIDSANDAMRFAVNTTIGGLGVMDWASDFGLEKHNEDFGQTFGKWGIPDGPYVVWPILGSSNARDSVGSLLDMTIDPIGRYKPIAARNVMYGTRVVGVRADLLEASRLLEEVALDKYSFQRDAYIQRRRSLIFDGDPPREARAAQSDVPN